jgi:hypothetical protein
MLDMVALKLEALKKNLIHGKSLQPVLISRPGNKFIPMSIRRGTRRDLLQLQSSICLLQKISPSGRDDILIQILVFVTNQAQHSGVFLFKLHETVNHIIGAIIQALAVISSISHSININNHIFTFYDSASTIHQSAI